MAVIIWGDEMFLPSADISAPNTTVASGSTFTLTLPTINMRWLSNVANWSEWLGLACDYYPGSGWVNRDGLGLYYGNTRLANWTARTTSSIAKSYSYSAAVWNSAPSTFNTSVLFNTNNPTSRTEYLYLIADEGCAFSEYNSQYAGEIGPVWNESRQTAATFPVTLNAPPVFNSTPTMTKDTAGYYINATTVTVTTSAYAQYGGNLTNVTLTIGSQTVTRSNSGSLSIKLNAFGTFTPRVTITDSRGQSSSVELTSFTVIEGIDTTFDYTEASSDKEGFWTRYSTASTTVSNVSIPYEGTITDIKFTIGNQSVSRTTEGTLSIIPNNAGTFTPTVAVSDSLGRTFTENLNPITINQYMPPSITFQVYRAKNVTEGGVTKYGIKDDEATTHILVQANITYVKNIGKLLQPVVKVAGTIKSNLTWYATYSETNGLSNSINWATYSPNSPVVIYTLIAGNFPQADSFVVGITVSDSTGESSVEIQQTLSPAFFTVDFLAGGHGIAFGQPAALEGFYCAMQANFNNFSGVMRSIFDLFYPKGSYYETFLTSVPPSGRTIPTQEDLLSLGVNWFNPNYAWGGTWILETAGQVHVSAGTGYAVSGAESNVSDGGSKDAIIPYHNHIASGGGVSNQAAFTSGGAGGHNHSFTRITTNKQTNYSAATTYSPQTSGGSTSDYSTSSVGDHTHTIPEHGHSFTQPMISYAGTDGNTTDANMQPYIVVYRWFRTA